MSSELLAGTAFLPRLAAGAGLARLLGQQDGLDVGQDAALGDGHAGQQLVELLVVTDGQLQMAGDDAGLLVVAGSVSRQLEHLGGQVLEHGGQVDGSAGADSLAVVALAQQTMDTAHGELETGPRGARLSLRLGLSALATTRHFCFSFGGSTHTRDDDGVQRKNGVNGAKNRLFIGLKKKSMVARLHKKCALVANHAVERESAKICIAFKIRAYFKMCIHKN